ncbi:MAG TPA: hypothetical protein PK629_03370 [Oscillospiraceae bacterium]|nr:hypothetical protein [Oscillospiraceae bacterium]HPK34748.1 hypothetical protein [Oscillospiraceae bacterium]
MFKKLRKYLIVLMAVVMVASLAVIPTSAAISGQGYNYIVSGTLMYWRSVWVTAESNQPLHCYASVTDKFHSGYDYDTDMAMSGSVFASVTGPAYYMYSDAEACIGVWEYGYGY